MVLLSPVGLRSDQVSVLPSLRRCHLFVSDNADVSSDITVAKDGATWVGVKTRCGGVSDASMRMSDRLSCAAVAAHALGLDKATNPSQASTP